MHAHTIQQTRPREVRLEAGDATRASDVYPTKKIEQLENKTRKQYCAQKQSRTKNKRSNSRVAESILCTSALTRIEMCLSLIHI